MTMMRRCSGIEPVPAFRAGRTGFQRGNLVRTSDGDAARRPAGDPGSGILSSMAQANGFIVLPERTRDHDAGSRVGVPLLEGRV